MNAAEILANAAKVVEKAQEWSDEQKLQAASEILHVLKGKAISYSMPTTGSLFPAEQAGPEVSFSVGQLRLGDCSRPLVTPSTACQTPTPKERRDGNGALQ